MKNTHMRRLNDSLNLSSVPRWSISRMMIPQSVAEHSHRTAVIAVELCYILGDYDAQWCALWATFHDATESITGDVPSPLKDVFGREYFNGVESSFAPWLNAMKALVGPRVVALVKIADQIEGYTWWKIAGDPTINHPWIVDGEPQACNETTIVGHCFRLGPIMRTAPERLINAALTICHSIEGGALGPATEIAITIKTQAYIRRYLESQGTGTTHVDPRAADAGS